MGKGDLQLQKKATDQGLRSAVSEIEKKVLGDEKRHRQSQFGYSSTKRKNQRCRVHLRYMVVVLTGNGTDPVVVVVEVDFTVVTGVGTLRHSHPLEITELGSVVR